MKKRKSKKRDKSFLDLLLKKSKKAPLAENNGTLLENILDTIMSEKDADPGLTGKTKSELLREFVDWNEIRLVAPYRLLNFFEKHSTGEYKRKVVQALLNKIFSRSGSLDYQFLLDFEGDALEDYLSGIMEMNEETRKLLLVRVFRRPILPISSEQEAVFQMAGTTYVAGDEVMKETFSKLQPEELEGIKALFDQIMSEQGIVPEGEGETVDIKSKTLLSIMRNLEDE